MIHSVLLVVNPARVLAGLPFCSEAPEAVNSEDRPLAKGCKRQRTGWLSAWLWRLRAQAVGLWRCHVAEEKGKRPGAQSLRARAPAYVPPPAAFQEVPCLPERHLGPGRQHSCLGDARHLNAGDDLQGQTCRDRPAGCAVSQCLSAPGLGSARLGLLPATRGGGGRVPPPWTGRRADPGRRGGGAGSLRRPGACRGPVRR